MQPGEEEEEEIAEDDNTYEVPRHLPPLRGRGGPIHRPVVPLMPRAGTGQIFRIGFAGRGGRGMGGGASDV